MAGARRPRHREPEWLDFAAAGVVEAAIEAVDLALARRADKLLGAASRVRTKQADRVLDALLREYAVTPASLRGSYPNGRRGACSTACAAWRLRELNGRPSL